MKEITELLNKLHIRPKSVDIYNLALTHSSYNAEAKTKHKDYERLEFMGDSVLGFVSATLIFKLHPDMNQGTMTKLRSHLVQSKSLADYARKIELYNYVKTGHSIDSSTIKESDKILEDVFEAFIGAIYLDAGLKKAGKFISYFIEKDIKHFDEDELTDYKTRLQEEMQSEFRNSVTYNLLSKKGPSHNPSFIVEVLFNGIPLATGEGKSIKKAEQNAAKKALEKKAV